MKPQEVDIAIIGAGIIGIATAYYLKQQQPGCSVVLIDSSQPMSFTSAQSGENYRNWWPHQAMKSFVEHSIQLMEQIDLASSGLSHLTRRGYLLATRENDVDDLLNEISAQNQLTENMLVEPESIRIHSKSTQRSYAPPVSENWQDAPKGIDVLTGRTFIQSHFPSLDKSVKKIIHIRNGGMVDSQSMATYLLDAFKSMDGGRVTGSVVGIDKNERFKLSINSAEKNSETSVVMADQVVNAAGPFVEDVAAMLGVSLPVKNILQQKIAFQDRLQAIPRDLPFTIDLDSQFIDWTEEEKNMLSDESELAWMTKELPGFVHCRPEGGDNGDWLKLGWAFNEKPTGARQQPLLDDFYPEIVLRGAARLNPSLARYYHRLPRSRLHYGGYYTMTEENWPLIGPTSVEGFYLNSAMSGFGTMAACAAGELCSQWIFDLPKPAYAKGFSLDRYNDRTLMDQLGSANRGIL